MRYRYLVDLRRGISVFAIFSYGIAVLGTPQCPPLLVSLNDPHTFSTILFFFISALKYPLQMSRAKKPLLLKSTSRNGPYYNFV